VDDQATAQPVYVTRWGLTQGILKFEAGQGHICHSDSGDQVYFSARWGNGYAVFVGRQDWTYSLDEAQARVSELVQRKLRSMEKQRRKLLAYKPKMVEPVKGNA
jgi:hypothetical protein